MKKLFSTILSLLMCLNVPISSAFASNKIEYMVLGDSIASGYQPNGLVLEKGNYSDIIKEHMENEGTKVNLSNYAIPGQTTQLLKEQLKDMDISKADVITISIGSNNMLAAFNLTIAKIVNAKSAEQIKIALENMFKAAQKKGLIVSLKDKKIANALENSKVLNDAINSLESELESVVDIVRAKNPNAILVFTNFYNPYAFVKGLDLKAIYGYTAGMISRMNDILTNLSIKKGFVIADVNFIGEDKSYLNVNLDAQNLLIDPHPNQKGHEAMALAIGKVIENII